MSLARNKTFHADREPLRHTDTIQLNTENVDGPISFLNPTQARFEQPSTKCRTPEEKAEAEETKPWENLQDEDPLVEYKWTSRNNRKGRHALVISSEKKTITEHASFPRPTSTATEILKGIRRMFTYFPVWDISYLVAVVFTFGSAVWIVSSSFVFFPLVYPELEFPGEVIEYGGITAFIGTNIFVALERLYDEHISDEYEPVTRVVPVKENCTHHHGNNENLVGRPTQRALTHLSEKVPEGRTIQTFPEGANTWIWVPSWTDLRTYYLHDLGFLACSTLMVGVMIFWISGVASLPPIFTSLDSKVKLDCAYWGPQLIGGICFVISGGMFTIETQKHVWLPAPEVLGWHVGFWNLVGGIGFTLCPIFGLLGTTKHWTMYQASCSSFWGSCAFFVGSAIQWYESLDKYPVEK